MNRIATADINTRSTAFAEAGQRLKMSAVIVEKDFWVCWMLGLLFGREDLRNKLVFKGGTALSKVFGVIRRFSEDIDLSLAPAVLDISEDDVEKASTRKQQANWMEEMETRCCTWADETLRPELELDISAVLGVRADGKPWLTYERDEASHSPVLFFHYPCAFGDGAAYIRRSVKLEFGSLTDQQPTGWHRVRPWLADVLPNEMREMGCEVLALEVERAFWEKATILHVEYHRDAAKPMPGRYSRHYADLAALAQSEHASKAVADAELRQRVVNWKKRFFAAAWAGYDLAKPDTFRLLPPEHRMPEIEKDYREMAEMFLDDPPPLSVIMATLKELEDQINRGA